MPISDNNVSPSGTLIFVDLNVIPMDNNKLFLKKAQQNITTALS